MTIDEVLNLLKANLPNALTPLQELVLRDSWSGKTYTKIASSAHYGEERVRKVASNLWQSLSAIFGESITKNNFRQVLEPKHLTKKQQQSIKEFNRAASAVSLEFPSGPVSLDSRFYLNRPPIEELAYAEIKEPGGMVCIKAPKQMGKSSLILRILAHARLQDYRTVSLDFKQADRAVFANLDKFLRWFCANTARELQLDPKLNDYWDEEMGSKVSCSIYFQRHLLSSSENPLVLALNEIDWVFQYPEIATDFLPLLRSWHEQSKSVDILQKLRIVIAYSTDILVPLNLTHSPFDIGFPLRLQPFTKEQVKELAQRHGLDWNDGNDAQSLMSMVGGHPYLVRLALYHLVGKGGLEGDLRSLLQQASTDNGIYNDYLRQYVIKLGEEPELAKAFYEVITASAAVKLEPVVAYKLQSLGLVNLEGDRATPFCSLFTIYFRNLLDTGSELENTRVSELEKENQELRFLSGLDELTQLPNRRYFNTTLQIEWKRNLRSHTPISLVLCDLDYFKFYNRTYGSSAGDSCLQQVTSAIRKCINRLLEANPTSNSSLTKNSIFLARYGGEEFAIVLSQADANTAGYLAESIRSQIKALAIPSEYPGIGGLPANVLTASIGVASTIPQSDSDPATLITVVEEALYQAKRKGRDRVIII